MTTPNSSPFAAFFKWANLLLIITGCAALMLYRISLRAHTGPDILWFLKIALVQCVLYVFVAWLVIKARAARSTLIIVIVLAVLFRLSLLFHRHISPTIFIATFGMDESRPPASILIATFPR